MELPGAKAALAFLCLLRSLQQPCQPPRTLLIGRPFWGLPQLVPPPPPSPPPHRFVLLPLAFCCACVCACCLFVAWPSVCVVLCF